MVTNSNDFRNIKNVDQLDMAIRTSRIAVKRAQDSLSRDLAYAQWYYNPARAVSGFKDRVLGFFSSFLKIMAIVSVVGSSMTSCSSEPKNQADDFKYCVDDFADIEVIRYKIPDWDGLSLQQQTYIYYLSQSILYGRDIIWAQNYQHNIAIRKAIEAVYASDKVDKGTEDWAKFEVYAKRVFFSNGIHHHYSEDKFFPECSAEYLTSILNAADVENVDMLVDVMVNPEIAPVRKYQDNDKDIVLASANNLYSDNITYREAANFYNAMERKEDSRPISYGLNSKLVKDSKGRIFEQVYKVGGLYGDALEKVVENLKMASKYAENDAQRAYIADLVAYYCSGDLKLWDEYNIKWVQELSGNVDFINGFVETYGDPLGRKANWEGQINFKDVEASNRTEVISDNAQWFEDNSPVDKRFKKSVVKGVTAKVINVAQISGDAFPATAIGVNLPNAAWIRKEFGSKSVTISNITEAYDMASNEKPQSMLSEFAWDNEEIERAKKYGYITGNIHTDLHECLGHGSGQLLPGVSPNALKEFHSPIEEARADLFALYYIADPKMVELGILDDVNAYKAEYDSFIRNGLFTQFTRIELGKKNIEAHMQDRKLIAQWSFERGAADKVIEIKKREGKSYFVINDYEALRDIFGELLAEIQRITSEGDYNAAKEMVARYAVDIDPILHKEVLERYASLNLKPYRGFVNPSIVPTIKDGEIVSVDVVYGEGFVEQHLRYGKEYSTL